MLCIDNQVVDIALPVVYTLRTRQCFNVLWHFSSDSANLIIFRDVHAIINVKVFAIGISGLAIMRVSNLNYFVSFEVSVLIREYIAELVADAFHASNLPVNVTMRMAVNPIVDRQRFHHSVQVRCEGSVDKASFELLRHEVE